MTLRVRARFHVLLAVLILAAPGTVRAGVFDPFVGTYTGTWFNNTFASSGSAQLALAIDGTDVTMTATMGGNVFGIQFDPDPVVIPGTISGDQIDFDTTVATFGRVVATITSAGAVSYTLTMIPGTSFLSITGMGTIGSGEWNLDYEIDATPMTTFDGIVTLVPEPSGAAPGMLALTSLLGLRRVRSGPSSAATM